MELVNRDYSVLVLYIYRPYSQPIAGVNCDYFVLLQIIHIVVS